jgi:rhamnosyl/mannosyltransferase
MFSAVMDRAQCIISTSARYAESSPELAPYHGRVRIVPYGIEAEPYEAESGAATANGLRKRFGSRVVLAAGRLIYYKGFDVLLEAMTRVDAHLVLVGEGPLRDALERKTRALGLEPRVTFAGEVHQREIAAWYRAADVFAFPSVARSEAFGIVQLEAMASGIPVVNTHLDSGVPFVSLDKETGFTVPPQDPAALAAALNSLLGNAKLREEMGRKARQRVRELFTKDRMVGQLRSIYRQVLDSAPVAQAVVAA